MFLEEVKSWFFSLLAYHIIGLFEEVVLLLVFQAQIPKTSYL